MKNYRSSHRMCFVKKYDLKNFANFTGKHLRCSLLLIKRQDFWLATLLKRDSNTGVFLREHSEIFKNAYFEVQILEIEIYSCFFMSKVVHSVLGKVKKEYWNSYSKRNMAQCKILIQLFPSWKLSSPTPIITRFGW